MTALDKRADVDRLALLVQADEAQEAGDFDGALALWLRALYGVFACEPLEVSTGKVWTGTWFLDRPVDLYFCGSGEEMAYYWFRDGVWERQVGAGEEVEVLDAPPDFVRRGVMEALAVLAKGSEVKVGSQ